MLCRDCRRQVSRTATVCGHCGVAVAGRGAVLDLVLPNGTRIALVDSLTIGRGAGNAIQLDEPTVSRKHARISAGDAPTIEDIGSSYGTFVDGKRVAGPEPLRDGASIEVGETTLRLEARRGPAESGRTLVVPVGATLSVSALGGGALTAGEQSFAHRPRLRSGWALKRLEADEGELRWVLRDLATGEFVRMTSEDAGLLELLDGTRSLQELVVASELRLGRGGAARLASLLADLGDRGLLSGVERAETRPASGFFARLFRPHDFVFGSAPRVFEGVYARGGFLLFTRRAVALIAAVATCGVGAFAFLVSNRYGTPFVVARRVGLGGAVFLAGRFLVVVLHELAHGLTVVSLGRRVQRSGIKVVLVFPYGFVDTSEAWFEPRRRRLAISGAGPVCDLAVGGAAALAALPLAAGALRDVFFQLAFAAYIGALFNLNPLLDRDGYHLLVDLLGEPGLRRRSREWLTLRLSGRRANLGDAAVLATYAVAALVWSLATAVFTILLSQRYYSHLVALAPRPVVLVLLGAFYLLMFLPIGAVFWRAVSARRDARPHGLDDVIA